MAKHIRKGRNPGPVDEWLDTLGYYRKNVAYDETCLFRAVSEQIYCCQLFHEKIRMECIKYATEHPEEFKTITSIIKNWSSYLDKLSKHMAVCGNTEIQIISKTYKRRVILFDGLNRCMEEVTSEPYEKELLLCHMGEDHYDVVHKREYIQNAGFCQSIVYNTLYENVFGIPKVSDIVQTMLYQKSPFVSKVEYINEDNNKISHKERDAEDLQLNDYEYMLKTNIAPFPFKVAKALDPAIYRNIEYDTWTEMRKEMRLGEWYYGDNNLIQGSGCILKENGQDLHCYIQEIVKDSETCVVYITSRAEKRRVKLSELRPEADAKPWPLPYRFCKNLVLSIPKVDIADKKNARKKRDKKNSVSKGSNDSESQVENNEGNVSAFEGAPLQIQLEMNTYDGNENEDSPQSQMYNYSDGAWGNNDNLPQTPEPIMWSPAPITPQSVVYNPNVSVPTTPEVFPDQRFYCETYPRYNVWTNGEYVAPLPSQSMSPSPVEVPQSPNMFSYFFSDPTYSPAPYYNSASITAPPPVELYPQPYITPHPGTPVILAPTEVAEVVMPNTPGHVLYSPAIEVPYMPSPYIYPPTPPAAWYQPSINAQGFIFPTIPSPAKTPSQQT